MPQSWNVVKFLFEILALCYRESKRAIDAKLIPWWRRILCVCWVTIFPCYTDFYACDEKRMTALGGTSVNVSVVTLTQMSFDWSESFSICLQDD